MEFVVKIKDKTLVFDSDLRGLKIGEKEYKMEKNGELIYNTTKEIKSDTVELQMSANTSTLIPALRILSLPYNSYFDRKEVVESQNDIRFYWDKSKLAAYYNRFSTDDINYDKRENVIKKAVKFLTKTGKKLPLKDEYLAKVLEPSKQLGFYEGFPIYDGSVGMAKLQSRLGIHIGSESIMISTPMEKYEEDVYDLAELISQRTGEDFSRKKNRVIFQKSDTLMKLFRLL